MSQLETAIVVAFALGFPGSLLSWGIFQSIRRLAAEAFADWQQVSAPYTGSDRAGGPSNGHPALTERQREGAAAAAGDSLAKDGNGAPFQPGDGE